MVYHLFYVDVWLFERCWIIFPAEKNRCHK